MTVAVNWTKLYGMLGMTPTAAADAGPGMAAGILQWVQANFIVSACFVLGFLVGLRIG